MDLEIKEEKYKIQVGKEVYTIEYPSFDEAQKIAAEFKKLGGSAKEGEKSLDLMKKWLEKLGLDPKFFKLKAVKSKHIMTVWGAINGVKK